MDQNKNMKIRWSATDLFDLIRGCSALIWHIDSRKRMDCGANSHNHSLLVPMHIMLSGKCTSSRHLSHILVKTSCSCILFTFEWKFDAAQVYHDPCDLISASKQSIYHMWCNQSPVHSLISLLRKMMRDTIHIYYFLPLPFICLHLFTSSYCRIHIPRHWCDSIQHGKWKSWA